MKGRSVFIQVGERSIRPAKWRLLTSLRWWVLGCSNGHENAIFHAENDQQQYAENITRWGDQKVPASLSRSRSWTITDESLRRQTRSHGTGENINRNTLFYPAPHPEVPYPLISGNEFFRFVTYYSDCIWLILCLRRPAAMKTMIIMKGAIIVTALSWRN